MSKDDGIVVIMSRRKTGKAPTSPDGTSPIAEPPPLTPKHALYYNVSEDTFGMDTPAHGTLFKRRTAAVAIQQSLRSEVKIVVCRVSRHGRLIQSSVPQLRPNWRRKSRLGPPAKPRHA
jgi:hypothetical protein